MDSIKKHEFETPVAYTIISTGAAYSVALKMEREKAGPHFVRIDKDTQLKAGRKEDQVVDWSSLVSGDSVKLSQLEATTVGKDIPLSTAAPFWPMGRVNVEAVALKGVRRSCVPRRTNLAFISMAKGQERNSGRSIAKFYDPLSLTEQLLPGSAGRGFKKGEPILVEYAVRPAGTWRHTSYSVTPDIPYEPTTCLKTREDSYDVIGATRISKEALKQYEEIYNRADGREEDQRATAIEEVLLAGAAALQSMARAAQRLYWNTIRPTVEREDDDEIILRASYHPRGGDTDAMDNDLARAARVFRFNQHISVIPQGNRGDYNDRFTLVPIRSSKVLKDSITFTLGMRKGLAEDLWDEDLDSLTQKPWEFKVSQQQILQRHFLKKLRDGGIRKLFALFGDKEALPKVETGPMEHYYPTTNGSLTQEQGRAVTISLRDEVPLSTMQAPAGSGKTTTISSMVLEQTKRENRCTAVTSAMNIAIDSLASTLAKQTKFDHRRIIVLQSSSYLAKCSAGDPYHDHRLPVLLVRLAEGAFGLLNAEEKDIVKSAIVIATRRFNCLQGMDWGNVLHGEVKMEDREDFYKAVELLFERYQPEIVLGTTSALNAWADLLQPYVTDIVIDEAGTVAVLDATCFLMCWDRALSLTLVGDIKQLPNFSAPLPPEYRIWGFESVLQKAFVHRSTENTVLTKVFRSHPLIVQILSLFAYDGELQTDVREDQRPLMLKSGLPLSNGAPILVVDCDGKHESNAAKSFVNAEQTRLACNIAQRLGTRLAGRNVKFLSMYSGARDEMNEGFHKHGLTFQAVAVDAAQGQECHVTVLETAFNPTKDTSNRFFDTRERLTVAISRARDGLVIIGSVTALMKHSKQWKRLLEIIGRVCPGAIVHAEDILRDVGTPVSNLALALKSFGLPSQDGHERPAEEESGDWMPAPPPAPPVLAAVDEREEAEESMPRTRRADEAGIGPGQAPATKRVPSPQPEEAMEADHQQEEQLVWSQPDPAEAAAARAFLRMPGATLPSDDESPEIAVDRHVVIDEVPSDWSEHEEEEEERASVRRAEKTPDEKEAIQPEEAPSVPRKKLLQNEQKKPQPTPHSQKPQPKPRARGASSKQELTIEDLFGNDSDFETDSSKPKETTKKKKESTPKPSTSKGNKNMKPQHATGSSTKEQAQPEASRPVRKPRQSLFKNP